jgi:hypothetical protein
MGNCQAPTTDEEYAAKLPELLASVFAQFQCKPSGVLVAKFEEVVPDTMSVPSRRFFSCPYLLHSADLTRIVCETFPRASSRTVEHITPARFNGKVYVRERIQRYVWYTVPNP